MDKKLLQTLSSLISKMPKKDLEKNIEKAKSILKNSNKEDIQKILSTPQIKKIIGKDAENLTEQISKIDLEQINIKELENKLKN